VEPLNRALVKRSDFRLDSVTLAKAAKVGYVNKPATLKYPELRYEYSELHPWRRERSSQLK
jgi:hypothetical protein